MNHTPTPWKVQRKPLVNVAMSGDKDTFRIMEGEKVIASIPRSWKMTPTDEDLSCGAEPIATRTAKQAEGLAAYIVRAVNAHKELLEALKSALEVLQVQGLAPVTQMQAEKALAKAEGKGA